MLMFTSTHKAMVRTLQGEVEDLKRQQTLYWRRTFGAEDDAAAARREARRAADQADRLERKYVELLRKWNDLVTKVNNAGGKEDRYGKLHFEGVVDVRFTNEDLTRMRMLCHPDKHAGKPMAHEITQKLNNLLAKK